MSKSPGFGSTAPFVEPLWYSRGRSVHYDASHERLRAAVRLYVDEKISPFCAEWEAQGFVPAEVSKNHSQLGFTATSLGPTLCAKYMQEKILPGGIGVHEWNGFHGLIAVDEITRCGYLGVIWALGGGAAIGCPPVVKFGSDALKQRFLPPVLRGEVRFCLGITEPDAGSDVASITTTAQRKGNVYIVNGAKKWITNGIWADYCTAAVRTGGSGKGGISALIIPLSRKGVTRRRILNSGVQASGSAFLEFDNVEVPCSNLIGEENKGFNIIMSNFNPERMSLAGASLSLGRVCLEDAYSHALTRVTFGSSLISHQAIRNKFVNLGIQIHAAQSFMESIVALAEAKRAARDFDPQDDVYPGGLVAMLKIMAARALEQTVRESQQIMGGLGYTRTGKGARIEQISRDVRVTVVGGGSEEILMDLAFMQERKDLRDIAKFSTKSVL